jgi:dUTPase
MKTSTDRELDRIRNRVRFALISETATPPSRNNITDAGIDLYLDLLKQGITTIDLYPNAVQIFHTGVKVCIPRGHVGWIANKGRADYLIGGGIIDQEYQGEILVKVINVTNDILTFNHRDPIAQLLIIPCITPKILITDSASLYENESDRGEGGGIVRQTKMELRGD